MFFLSICIYFYVHLHLGPKTIPYRRIVSTITSETAKIIKMILFNSILTVRLGDVMVDE